MGEVDNYDFRTEIGKLSGVECNLSAPVVKHNDIYRPSFAGDKSICEIVAAKVDFIQHDNGASAIGLEIDQVSTGIGRPVFRYSSSNRRTCFFGDSESTDSQYTRLDLLIQDCGYAILRAAKRTGGPKILTGVTAEEARAFAIGCSTAVKIHRANEKKRTLEAYRLQRSLTDRLAV